MAQIKAIHLPGWWVAKPATKETFGSFAYTENNLEYIGVCFRSWYEHKQIRQPDKIIIVASKNGVPKNGVPNMWKEFRSEYVEEATDNKFKPWLEKAEILYLTGALDDYCED